MKLENFRSYILIGCFVVFSSFARISHQFTRIFAANWQNWFHNCETNVARKWWRAQKITLCHTLAHSHIRPPSIRYMLLNINRFVDLIKPPLHETIIQNWKVLVRDQSVRYAEQPKLFRIAVARSLSSKSLWLSVCFVFEGVFFPTFGYSSV